MNDKINELIDLLNEENSPRLRRRLSEYGGVHACLYLLQALCDGRCHATLSGTLALFREEE